MRPQLPPFKLNRQVVLLGIVSATFPLTGYCIAAGRADFVIGKVEAITANGNRRALVKGGEINAGDTIATATDARAQLHFIDGGFVSLQPSTQFRVDEFNYKNNTDGEEKGFFSLLKGSLRAITGAIGHVNRNTYQVATPTATIGIRGTGYKAEIRDEGLFVSVGEGAISLTNNAGLLVVAAGGAAFVLNKNTAPVPTGEQPQTPPQGLQTPTLMPVRDSSGNLSTMKLTSGSGYSMAYAYSGSGPTGGAAGGSVGLTNATATFNSSDQLTQYNQSVNDVGSLGTGSVAFSASDGIIGWGRWVGGTSFTAGPVSGLTNVTFDYVAGIPTSAMPTTGTATYSLLGNTSPTDSGGSTGYIVKNATLTVNFGASSNQVGVNMTVANATNTYVTNGSVSIGAGTASFNGTIAIPNSAAYPTTCTLGCTTTINGFFSGIAASRAGLSYSIVDNSITSIKIQGVTTYTKN